MGQLTIYIDDETLAKIGKSARRDKESVSAWVKKRLTGAITSDWPKDFFRLFGSLRDAGFSRPPQPDWADDRKREEL